MQPISFVLSKLEISDDRICIRVAMQKFYVPRRLVNSLNPYFYLAGSHPAPRRFNVNKRRNKGQVRSIKIERRIRR